MNSDLVLQWLEQGEASWLGQLIRESVWLFPVIEAVHLLGLCLLGGAVLLVDLRLLGLGLRSQSIALVARDARPWLRAGVLVMLTTGSLLFISEAVKCFHNPSFWVKMSTLPFALLFTLVVRQRLAVREPAVAPWMHRLLATVSLALWFTVAMAGRWIGFSS
ncbi:MAG: DUF6644 family protein [Gemmatimonas sp.]